MSLGAGQRVIARWDGFPARGSAGNGAVAGTPRALRAGAGGWGSGSGWGGWWEGRGQGWWNRASCLAFLPSSSLQPRGGICGHPNGDPIGQGDGTAATQADPIGDVGRAEGVNQRFPSFVVPFLLGGSAHGQERLDGPGFQVAWPLSRDPENDLAHAPNPRGPHSLAAQPANGGVPAIRGAVLWDSGRQQTARPPPRRSPARGWARAQGRTGA